MALNVRCKGCVYWTRDLIDRDSETGKPTGKEVKNFDGLLLGRCRARAPRVIPVVNPSNPNHIVDTYFPITSEIDWCGSSKGIDEYGDFVPNP